MNIAAERQPTIQAALDSIGTEKQLSRLGLFNGRVCSRRTVSFDFDDRPLLASEPTLTINRVKITAHSDGKVDVKLLEVAAETKPASRIVPLWASGEAVQHAQIEGIEPADVGTFLKAQIGLGAK